MIKASRMGTALAVAGITVGALVGCATSANTPAVSAKVNASTPKPTVATSPSSTPTPSTAASTAETTVGKIPTKCKSLMSATTYKKKVFSGTPLTQPTPPKTQLTAALTPGGTSIYCLWRDPRADISGISIEVVTVDSAKALAQLKKLPAKGFTCKTSADAYTCQKIGKDSQYPVETGDTYYTQGDIGIRIQQANVPTSGLLAEVVARVF
jgi:hypothetical protein